MRRDLVILSLASLAVVVIVFFRGVLFAEPVLKEQSSDPPCAREKFDGVGLIMLKAEDWREIARKEGTSFRGEAIRTGIDLRPESAQDFLDRWFPGRIEVLVNGFARFGAKWPSVVALVQFSDLCELSLQPEVTRIRLGRSTF